MLGGIPPSIHYGGARKLASRRMPVRSLRLVFCSFNQLWESELRLYFNRWDIKSWYAPQLESGISEPYFSLGCWVEIDRTCWVEIFSTQHQNIIPSIENSLIRPLQRSWFCYTFICGFSQYLHVRKHHNLFHQSLTAGSNSSLWDRGHVGCWVEFHPPSLSDNDGGWLVARAV